MFWGRKIFVSFNFSKNLDVVRSYRPVCGDKRFIRAKVDEQANSANTVNLGYEDILLAPDMLIGITAGIVAIAYEDIAESLAANGIAAVLIDYPADDGKYDYVTEAEDLMAVVDGVTSLTFIYCRNVFLWGHSFGGLAVTYAGCEYFPYYSQKFKGLILLEPSFDKSSDICEKMPQFGGKVLIITGTADSSVSISHPDLIEKAKNSFKSVDIKAIEGEDHYFTGTGRAEMIQATLDFIFNSMEK